MSSSDDHATLDAALTFVDEYVLADFEPVLTSSDHAGDTIPLLPLDALGDDDIVLERLSPIDQEHDDSFGTDTTATMEMTPSPSIKETESTQTKKRTTTNRSRARQKDELVYLRGVVADLEAQMVALKKRSEAHVGAKTEEPLAFAWEEVAARQYAQRRRAEVENAKLKTVLEEQIRAAKNLERVLKKRTIAKHLVSPAPKRKRTYQASSVDDGLHVFDELSLAIDDMYTQVTAVFADKRFTRTVPALNEIQARNDDDLGTIVEVFDSRLGPFDMDKISDATWHHVASQALDPNAFDDEVVEITDTMFKRKFSSSIDLPLFKGTYHVKIAARRIIEDERVLMLWAALVDPEKISDKPMDGLLLRQRGWSVLSRPPPGLVKADRSATMSQLYYTIVPEIDDDELSDQRRKVGTLTNFVLGSVNFHLEVARQMIENLLLQDLQKTPDLTASSPEPARSVSVSSAGTCTEHEPTHHCV